MQPFTIDAENNITAIESMNQTEEGMETFASAKELGGLAAKGLAQDWSKSGMGYQA